MYTDFFPESRINTPNVDVCRQDIDEQLKVMKGPIQWSIYITNRCNLKCTHCFNRSGVLKRRELSDECLLSVAHQIAELKPFGVCFCGGEPLIREQVLYKFSSILKASGVHINLVSNGYLMTSRKAQLLAKSGIELVQISLDGATAFSHDRLRNMVGAHQKALKAIKYLLQVGIRVVIAFTPTRYNIEEFKKLCIILHEYGVNSIRVQPIMPLGNLQDSNPEIFPNEEQYRQLVSLIQEFQANNTFPGLQLLWGDPVDHFIRFSTVYPTPLYCGEITSEGYLRISSYLPLFFGNVLRHTISEYWEAGYKNAWKMEITKTMAGKIRCIEDLAKTHPRVYYDEPVAIDLVDNTPEKIEGITKQFIKFQEET